MNRLITLTAYALAVCQLLSAADMSAALLKKVDPNEGRSKVGVVFDVAEVNLIMDATGVPFSLESSVGLPDYVVKALEQWRYSPYKKNGQAVPFAAKLTVPIARPLTPTVERNLASLWYPSAKEISQAIQRGRALNEAAAEALEADLPDAEALGDPRTSLLVYYANQGAKDPDKARAARAKLLTWLVEHYPQDEVLGRPFALVNSSGEALADPSASVNLAKLWSDAVKQYPTDEKVRSHALNFWQVASPQNALELLAKLPRWKDTSPWVGTVYGLAAVGVTALDPATGKALAVANLPGAGTTDEAARETLLKSADAKIVLVGLATVTRAGRSLAANGHLPEGYSAFCQKLLVHAKEFYPQTAQSCDTASSAQDDNRITMMAYEVEKLAEAKLLKRVQPTYPPEAKYRLVQGTIVFSALVNKSGEIEELGLKSGPFLLYPASLEAVKKWRFSPTLLDDKPVDISTVITVNFTLGR